jgi:hypothetical protein
MKPIFDPRQYIRESNAIEGITRPNEIEQSMVAWALLCDRKTKLSHGLIRKVQKIITLNQPELTGPKRGYYRDMTKTNVTVGNHVPPHYSMVRGLMDNWLLDYEQLGPWQAHVRFETIHPFVDGNGRTGRMLMWWHELMIGECPTLFKGDERQDYYKKLDAGR